MLDANLEQGFVVNVVGRLNAVDLQEVHKASLRGGVLARAHGLGPCNSLLSRKAQSTSRSRLTLKRWRRAGSSRLDYNLALVTRDGVKITYQMLQNQPLLNEKMVVCQTGYLDTKSSKVLPSGLIELAEEYQAHSKITLSPL